MRSDPDRSGERSGCILSHGVALLVQVDAGVVTTILPDPGHRLKECKNDVTSSNPYRLLNYRSRNYLDMAANVARQPNPWTVNGKQHSPHQARMISDSPMFYR